MSGYRCPWCEFTAVVASIVTKDHEPECGTTSEPSRGATMSTDRLLRTHRLVSSRWRVYRPDGSPLWLAHPIGHPEQGASFDHLDEALTWAREQFAVFGVRP